MERVRTVTVRVEVDTNKRTHATTFEMGDDGNVEALLALVRDYLDATTVSIGLQARVDTLAADRTGES